MTRPRRAIVSEPENAEQPVAHVPRRSSGFVPNGRGVTPASPEPVTSPPSPPEPEGAPPRRGRRALPALPDPEPADAGEITEVRAYAPVAPRRTAPVEPPAPPAPPARAEQPGPRPARAWVGVEDTDADGFVEEPATVPVGRRAARAAADPEPGPPTAPHRAAGPEEPVVSRRMAAQPRPASPETPPRRSAPPPAATQSAAARPTPPVRPGPPPAPVRPYAPIGSAPSPAGARVTPEPRPAPPSASTPTPAVSAPPAAPTPAPPASRDLPTAPLRPVRPAPAYRPIGAQAAADPRPDPAPVAPPRAAPPTPPAATPPSPSSTALRPVPVTAPPPARLEEPPPRTPEAAPHPEPDPGPRLNPVPRLGSSARPGANRRSTGPAQRRPASQRRGTRQVPPIVIDRLVKAYNGVLAVRNLSFEVEPGRITGFLGPNGAGKTTTLRILVGLVSPTTGTATFGGTAYADLPRPQETVGAVLDAKFHPGRTGRNHLRVLAATAGVSDRRVDDLLERVGLSEHARRPAAQYSLGMRQRLALAAALIGNPDYLILDEPANGLDPEGIRWLRQFLREFAATGRSVLVSSHLLNEVQATVDEIVVIHQGRLLAQMPMSELQLGEGTTRARVSDLEHAGQVLAPLGVRVEWATDERGPYLRVHSQEVAAVGAALFDAGIVVHELVTERRDLEQEFFSMLEASR